MRLNMVERRHAGRACRRWYSQNRGACRFSSTLIRSSVLHIRLHMIGVNYTEFTRCSRGIDGVRDVYRCSHSIYFPSGLFLHGALRDSNLILSGACVVFFFCAIVHDLTTLLALFFKHLLRALVDDSNCNFFCGKHY